LTGSEHSKDGDDQFNVEEREVEIMIPENKEERFLEWIFRKLNRILLWNVSDTNMRNMIGSEARQILIDKERERIRRRILTESLTNAVFSTNNENENQKMVVKNIIDMIEKIKQ